jgi:hypothetical protein
MLKTQAQRFDHVAFAIDRNENFLEMLHASAVIELKLLEMQMTPQSPIIFVVWPQVATVLAAFDRKAAQMCLKYTQCDLVMEIFSS